MVGGGPWVVSGLESLVQTNELTRSSAVRVDSTLDVSTRVKRSRVGTIKGGG